ncbi:MAG: hypothetical protein WBL65_12590 [Bryobacteraceae bacterium]
MQSVSIPGAGVVAGTSGRSAHPSNSTQAVAIPRQTTATAGLTASARVVLAAGKVRLASLGRTTASGAIQGDGPNVSVESGGGPKTGPAADPNAPVSNVPLFNWFKQATFPNQVRNPQESTAPAQSGGKSSDRGTPASDELPAGKKETDNSDAATLAAISFQPRPAQPLVSSKFSVNIEDGFESPAPGAPNGALPAPEVAANREGTRAANSAHTPSVQAAPSDTGITPPVVRSSSTSQEPGLMVSGPDPRVANAKAGTQSKAEPAPADLAVAVRVKAQTSPAASGQSAPAKELRRVDLADAPPAANLRIETSRAGAWVLNEGPARGGAQPAAETASRPPERPEATPLRAEEGAPKTSAPLKDLSVQMGQSNQESVELRVVEREGELHIAVRTGDAELAHGLRQGLPELVDRLDQSGFRAEAWRPAGVVSAPEPSSQAHSRSSDSRNADSQSQPGWSQQERGQRDHNQSNRPEWVEELEGNLTGGGERSTGEFHGFSH